MTKATRYRKLKDIKKKFRPYKHMIDEIYLFKGRQKQEGAPEGTRVIAGQITKRTETEIVINDSITVRREDIGFILKGNRDFGLRPFPDCSEWDYNINQWVRLN